MIEVTIEYPINRLVNEPASDHVHIEFVWPKRPFLFWSTKLMMNERLPLPKGFGVAWYDYMSARALMAPMPLNLLIGFLIWLYLWVKYSSTYWLVTHTPKSRK